MINVRGALVYLNICRKKEKIKRKKQLTRLLPLPKGKIPHERNRMFCRALVHVSLACLIWPQTASAGVSTSDKQTDRLCLSRSSLFSPLSRFLISRSLLSRSLSLSLALSLSPPSTCFFSLWFMDYSYKSLLKLSDKFKHIIIMTCPAFVAPSGKPYKSSNIRPRSYFCF